MRCPYDKTKFKGRGSRVKQGGYICPRCGRTVTR